MHIEAHKLASAVLARVYRVTDENGFSPFAQERPLPAMMVRPVFRRIPTGRMADAQVNIYPVPAKLSSDDLTCSPVNFFAV
jgi:hypothetical protein